MKKYSKVLLSLTIALLILSSVLLFFKSRDKDYSIPTWEKKTTDYVMGYSSVSTVDRVVGGQTRVLIDQTQLIKYEFKDKSQAEILVSVGDILEIGDMFFADEAPNSIIGRVEKITFTDSIIEIYISDFSKLTCLLYIPQKNIDEIKINQEVIIKYNDHKLEGFVRKKARFINDDGNLEVEIEIKENKVLMVGSFVSANIILYSKKDVLVIPKEALIQKLGLYFVDVIKDDIVTRKEIKIGVIGDSNVEVKIGLSSGEVVILNYDE